MASRNVACYYSMLQVFVAAATCANQECATGVSDEVAMLRMYRHPKDSKQEKTSDGMSKQLLEEMYHVAEAEYKGANALANASMTAAMSETKMSTAVGKASDAMQCSSGHVCSVHSHNLPNTTIFNVFCKEDCVSAKQEVHSNDAGIYNEHFQNATSKIICPSSPSTCSTRISTMDLTNDEIHFRDFLMALHCTCQNQTSVQSAPHGFLPELPKQKIILAEGALRPHLHG
eukprot:gnl/TRDRNA2_/TRDRNA2_81699_c0_seq1.p1 gnl/TRDRNA2_/TRDRNA2_81699_c0~~gnl/TRDRNA2_/TRDRNA2_81699_c0_seq1.p1  ORF type:complete len:230 (-),score=25.71 gnl/TRDRNA2_/TRDRNA2_81699_c0_seq1:223-912(-)